LFPALFAFPTALRLEIPVVFVAASGTLWAIGPAHGGNGVNAGLCVTVVENCLLKGFNFGTCHFGLAFPTGQTDNVIAVGIRLTPFADWPRQQLALLVGRGLVWWS
jgi:hypothetical protein